MHAIHAVPGTWEPLKGSHLDGCLVAKPWGPHLEIQLCPPSATPSSLYVHGDSVQPQLNLTATL